MNVIVCVKQIPDPALPGALDPATNTLKRDGKLILDESDSYGVEMALQLVDAAGGGEVSLVSMAPNGEVSGLRTALPMGAAKAVLVSDPSLQGSDALTTAKVLAAAVISASAGPTWSSRPPSRATATPAPCPSRWPRSSVCRRSPSPRRSPSTAAPSRSTGRPSRATTTSRARCLPSSASPPGVVEPRYPSFKGIMAAKSKPVDHRHRRRPGRHRGRLGRCRSGQDHQRHRQAEARQAGEIVEDDGETFTKVVAFLENLKVI